MSEHKIAKAVKDNAAKCFLESAEELGLIKGGILCYADCETTPSVPAIPEQEEYPTGNESPNYAPTDSIKPSTVESEYITQSIPTQSGKVAKIIIPIDAQEDDLYMIKDMLDIILKRKFKLS